MLGSIGADEDFDLAVEHDKGSISIIALLEQAFPRAVGQRLAHHGNDTQLLRVDIAEKGHVQEHLHGLVQTHCNVLRCSCCTASGCSHSARAAPSLPILISISALPA